MIDSSVIPSTRTTEYRARLEARKGTLKQILHETVSTDAPIVWEVGCGHGHFLTAYAAAHPERSCVGIDIVRDRIERATRKRNRAHLPHLHFILADAHDFLGALPADVKFSAIYVLFPDPWPKRRHYKNRLMQTAFLNAVSLRAEKGARLYFRTDFEPYFAEVSSLVRSHPHWEIIGEPFPFETETVFQARATNYFSLVARNTTSPGLA